MKNLTKEKICNVCGTTVYYNKKYCSDKCKKIATDTLRKDKAKKNIETYVNSPKKCRRCLQVKFEKNMYRYCFNCLKNIIKG